MLVQDSVGVQPSGTAGQSWRCTGAIPAGVDELSDACGSLSLPCPAILLSCHHVSPWNPTSACCGRDGGCRGMAISIFANLASGQPGKWLKWLGIVV